MKKIFFRLLICLLVICSIICCFTACKEAVVESKEEAFEVKYVTQYRYSGNTRIVFKFVYTQEMFDYLWTNDGYGFSVIRQIILNNDPLQYDTPCYWQLSNMYGISYSTLRDYSNINERLVNFKVGEDVYFYDYLDVGNYNMHFEIPQLNLFCNLYLEVK